MNSQSLRAAHKIIKAAYASIGKPDVVLTQSTLRLEASLSTTKTNYIFPLLESEGGVKATEIRLNQNDAFTAYGISIYLGLAAAADDSDTEFDLFPYNDKGVFTGIGVAKALNTVYNGKMKIDVNNKTVVQNWDVNKHKYVPTTQFASATDASLNFSEAGMVDCIPFITLSGAKKNSIELQLGKAVSALTASKDTRVVVILHGLLAQNAASFQV